MGDMQCHLDINIESGEEYGNITILIASITGMSYSRPGGELCHLKVYPTTNLQDINDMVCKSLSGLITKLLTETFPKQVRMTWEFNEKLKK